MKYSGQKVLQTILFIVLTSIITSAVNAQVKEQENLNALIGEYLKTSDINYKKISETAWIVNYKNEIMLVAAQKEYFLVGIVIAKKGQFLTTSESLSEILKLVHLLDFVKIGIDNDGDLFIRTEQKCKTLEKQEFLNYISIVNEAAQKARLKLNPFIIKNDKDDSV